MEVLSLEAEPLSIPLIEPFVIATGTMIATRSVLIKVRLREGDAVHVGLGEAAALPPVTDCDQPELLEFARAAATALAGLTSDAPRRLAADLAERIPSPVLRAGIEAAVLDAWSRANGRRVVDLLHGATPPSAFETDITIPIGEPEHMAELAIQHHARGFSVFKVKVGRDLQADVTALRAIASAVPRARFRIDANGGYSLEGARTLLAETRDLVIECFEQPCARGDETSMAELTRTSGVPIVADESLRDISDLEALVRTQAVTGVNLKLAKLGGLVSACTIGNEAKAAGLSIMCGAMVETRLGLTAMMHVAGALGGAEWIDLDTQMLLAREQFRGGYSQRGPTMLLGTGPGFDLTEIEAR